MKTLKVTLTVSYDEATLFNPDTIGEDLAHNIQMAIDRGLLTPTGSEEIDEFSLDVHEQE